MVENGDDIDTIIALLASMNRNSNFKRIGFVDTQGLARTTDGYTVSLGFRDFYRRSMEGEFVLTSTLTDRIGVSEPINVFSAPVYLSDESICGVVFATYRSEDFRHFFDMEDFDKTGSYCIVNSKSEVIAATESLPFDMDEENLLQYLDTLGPDAQKYVAEYYEKSDDPECLNEYYLRINKLGDTYIYFEPIDIGNFSEQWYLVSMVNEMTVNEQVSTTMSTITVMLLEICGLVIIAFTLFLIDSGSSERRQRRELERIAFIDPLTGGDNYARFLEKVSSQERSGYIVSMDLHAFKMINSVCGNERGDEVLRSIYRWIREEISGEDIVAHVNADRYILFFPRNERDEAIEKITLTNKKIAYETKKMNIPQAFAYFGITQYKSGDSVEKALSEANFARDSIHDKKNEFYSFFDQNATNRIMYDKQMEDDFDEAMMNGEFEVWYQPKISPDTEKIVGAEALVRWRKPDGALVPPGRFVPIFEGDGRIRLLDEFVFRETCKEQKKLLEKGCSVIPISVNLSRASIYSTNLVERYRKIADEVGVDPVFVPIEITESAAVDEKYMQAIAEQFCKNGFSLQVDDFGSGYSSLSTLNQMHFDALKIDKSLIDYIGNIDGDLMIKHTISLAKDLGMHVTAEGVENEQQAVFLLEQNCDSIQGFYYSRPLPEAQFEEMLARRQAVA
jgi:diguanylate cyclase (GGDEF)-like protein